MTCNIIPRGAYANIAAVATAFVAAAAPAAALVRLGIGGAAGFSLPAAAFDNDAKSAPAATARFYGNLFHWLTLEAGVDYDLPHDAESGTGVGETRLYALKAGVYYKVDMGIFKPFVVGGWAQLNERIKRETYWDKVVSQGFYLGPGLEYYFTERFAAFGAPTYNRAFDGARADGRDTQYVKLDFGINYYFW